MSAQELGALALLVIVCLVGGFGVGRLSVRAARTRSPAPEPPTPPAEPAAPPQRQPTHEERMAELGSLGKFVPKHDEAKRGGTTSYSFPPHWSAEDCAKVIEATGRAQAAELEAFGRAIHPPERKP